MKKTLSTLLVVALIMSIASVSALGELSTHPGFQPFDKTVSVKVVIGYNESDKPASGAIPSTCEWNSLLKECLNVELDWLWEVPKTQYDTKLDLSLASGQYPDILQCDFDTYCYLKEAGMLADLTDVWNTYASETLQKTINPYLYFTTTEEGLLAIPYASSTATNMQVNFWRTDWLNKLGMEMPATLDEFTAVIKAFRDNDPDGNGEKDTYGVSFYSDPFAGDISMLPIFNAFASYPNSWIEKDGKIVRGITQPETKEALDYLRGLYADGYIDPEFATYSQDQLKVDIVAGKIGQFGSKWYMPDYGTTQENMISDENATWMAAAMPGKTADAPAEMNCPEKIADTFNVVLKTAPEESKIAMIKILNIFYDMYFNASVENGGSGIDFWILKDQNSDEYKSHMANHNAWWCPVTIWHPASNLYKVDLIDKYIATGEWDDSIYVETAANKLNWENDISWLRAGREACQTEDDLKNYVKAYNDGITRFNYQGEGTCSLKIVDDLSKNGYTKMDVYYGAETETGLAVATTLNDMAVQYVCRYIMGLESEDSFNTFVENWNAMGGNTWTEEVNVAYAAFH